MRPKIKLTGTIYLTALASVLLWDTVYIIQPIIRQHVENEVAAFLK